MKARFVVDKTTEMQGNIRFITLSPERVYTGEKPSDPVPSSESKLDLCFRGDFGKEFKPGDVYEIDIKPAPKKRA